MKVVVLYTVYETDGKPDAPDPVVTQTRAALDQEGHETVVVGVDANVESTIAALRAAEPDLVLNLAESFGGKSALESNVAALLNLLGLRYTGSSPAGLMLAGDKSLTKKVLSFHGVKSPEFATVWRGAVDWAGDITFPLIVKPPQEDASLGLTTKSVVRDPKELLAKIGELQAQFQSPVLVERFIEGREYYVGVLGNAQARALPIIELDFSNFPPDRPRIASWEAKWGVGGEGKGEEFAGTVSIFPEDLPPELEERMRQVAIEAFHALRLRDYARIDLRVTAEEEVYVIEVNPNCYLEKSGEFARAAQREGLEYDALIANIVELASARYAH